jgi:hypothetical protein
MLPYQINFFLVAKKVIFVEWWGLQSLRVSNAPSKVTDRSLTKGTKPPWLGIIETNRKVAHQWNYLVGSRGAQVLNTVCYSSIARKAVTNTTNSFNEMNIQNKRS